MWQKTFALSLALIGFSPPLYTDTKSDILAVEKASWQTAAHKDA